MLLLFCVIWQSWHLSSLVLKCGFIVLLPSLATEFPLKL